MSKLPLVIVAAALRCIQRDWSLSADASEEREGRSSRRWNGSHTDTYALTASMLTAEI